MSSTLLLLLIGLVVIAALAGYAWRLTRQVKDQQQQHQQAEAEAAASLRAHHQELINDIQFIARSVLSEQCEITEGVLRLHHLIKGLDPEVWQQPELHSIRQHYLATHEMPILDAYKQLSRKEQFKLDNQRLRLEDEYKDGVHSGLKFLLGYSYPNVLTLH